MALSVQHIFCFIYSSWRVLYVNPHSCMSCITCSCVNWLPVNPTRPGQMDNKRPSWSCAVSIADPGHIWCQYILIAYCNSPFPGLNMLGQRPIFMAVRLKWSQTAITSAGEVLQDSGEKALLCSFKVCCFTLPTRFDWTSSDHKQLIPQGSPSANVC